MQKITKYFSSTNLVYGVIAIAAVAVMVFAVLPQFPQVASTLEKANFSAGSVFAWDTDFGGDCCGGEGEGGGWDTDFGGDCCESGGGTPESPDPTPPPAPRTPVYPSCDYLTANRTTVPYNGGNVTLYWETTNATSVSLTGYGAVAADNSGVEVFVSSPQTFTLSVSNADGNDSCSVRITVAPETFARCDFFTASPTTLPHGGGNVTLSWGTTNASWVAINNAMGTHDADGSLTTFVTQSTTYTLTTYGGADTGATCTASVTVEPPVVTYAATCDFLTASDTSLDEDGGNVTLSWGTTNATSVSINNGIGSVSADGSTTVFVNDTITYTLTATGTAGNDSCSVTIYVDEDEPAPRCDYLRVSDDDVEEGDEVTLEWETTNADDVSLNEGIGDVSNDGSMRVRVYDDTTYVLTVENDNREDTCSVRVEVDEDEDDDEPRPICELKISDRTVRKGDEVTLEWETRYADEVTIKDNHGNTIFRDRSVSDRADGEIEVEVTRDTEFTLNAEGDGGERECEVDVEVESNDTIVLTETVTPRIAGISLTQVPYTGFEAGKAVTFLFYALLTIWAAAVAYMLVIRKDTVLGFSLKGSEANGVIHEDRIVSLPYVASAVAAVPANLPTAPAVVGYSTLYQEAEEEVVDEASQTLATLEEAAHARNVLLSSDALRFLASEFNREEGTLTLNRVIDAAKATFPSEDGWVVLNLARLEELLGGRKEEVVSASFQPVPETSLASAIVTGDIVAAYQMIANRPMIMLAEAAASLDAAYRARRGDVNAVVDAGVASALASHTTEEIKAAIDALTGALDGTYTDEQSAVKVAIMKAVNAFAA